MPADQLHVPAPRLPVPPTVSQWPGHRAASVAAGWYGRLNNKTATKGARRVTVRYPNQPFYLTDVLLKGGWWGPLQSAQLNASLPEREAKLGTTGVEDGFHKVSLSAAFHFRPTGGALGQLPWSKRWLWLFWNRLIKYSTSPVPEYWGALNWWTRAWAGGAIASLSRTSASWSVYRSLLLECRPSIFFLIRTVCRALGGTAHVAQLTELREIFLPTELSSLNSGVALLIQDSLPS